MNENIFVGLGSGAIQLGLWGYYAYRRGMEIVLTEVDAAKLDAIRKNQNFYWINIAHFDRIVPVKVGPVKVFNPADAGERSRIVDYISRANDIVTAVPSSSIYQKGGIAQLIKDGLDRRQPGKPVMIYASENQIEAARMLEKLVFPEGTPPHVQFSDTVIARMGGPQSDDALIQKFGLQPLTSTSKEALLVEDFHDIIIETCKVQNGSNYHSAFSHMFATDHLNMYEEQKLYGHNGVHSVLGFLAKLKGYSYMSQYAGDPDFGYIGVDALREEVGAWFKNKYKQSREKIAENEGYENWVVQLCQRIINPFLYDSVDRVIRDPQRKLGWNDRLIGAMRNVFSAGIKPERYALGVAAGLLIFNPEKPALEIQENLSEAKALANLERVWDSEHLADKQYRKEILDLVGNSMKLLKNWMKFKNKYLYEVLKGEPT